MHMHCILHYSLAVHPRHPPSIHPPTRPSTHPPRPSTQISSLIGDSVSITPIAGGKTNHSFVAAGSKGKVFVKVSGSVMRSCWCRPPA